MTLKKPLAVFVTSKEEVKLFLDICKLNDVPVNDWFFGFLRREIKKLEDRKFTPIYLTNTDVAGFIFDEFKFTSEKPYWNSRLFLRLSEFTAYLRQQQQQQPDKPKSPTFMVYINGRFRIRDVIPAESAEGAHKELSKRINEIQSENVDVHLYPDSVKVFDKDAKLIYNR